MYTSDKLDARQRVSPKVEQRGGFSQVPSSEGVVSSGVDADGRVTGQFSECSIVQRMSERSRKCRNAQLPERLIVQAIAAMHQWASVSLLCVVLLIHKLHLSDCEEFV